MTPRLWSRLFAGCVLLLGSRAVAAPLGGPADAQLRGTVGAPLRGTTGAPLRGAVGDLTHAFDATTIYWPTEATGFVLTPEHPGRTDRRGVPAFENVANLDRLPANGFTVIALPMKIAGGSGGPLRIVAVVDATRQ